MLSSGRLCSLCRFVPGVQFGSSGAAAKAPLHCLGAEVAVVKAIRGGGQAKAGCKCGHLAPQRLAVCLNRWRNSTKRLARSRLLVFSIVGWSLGCTANARPPLTFPRRATQGSGTGWYSDHQIVRVKTDRHRMAPPIGCLVVGLWASISMLGGHLMAYKEQAHSDLVYVTFCTWMPKDWSTSYTTYGHAERG